MTELPEDPSRYFDTVPGYELVPIDRLLASWRRPTCVQRAESLMAAAYAGTHPRRRPIDVEARADGRLSILDGNSTYHVARLHGWTQLPVVLARTPHRGRGSDTERG